jgi:predicted dehydrogenase
VLQVGHLEWFNAAMRKVAASIRRPRFVESHRLGPFPGRATDVDVVRDLMIHDLDVIQRLVGEEPVRIEAIGVPVITDRVDIANARVGFPGGCVANLTASRVSPTPMRRIRFFQRDGYFSIDFLEQTVAIARRLESGPDGRREIDRQRLEIEPEDALRSQLGSFIEAVRTRTVRAGAAHDGLAALRTALRVIDAMPPLDDLQ